MTRGRIVATLAILLVAIALALAALRGRSLRQPQGPAPVAVGTPRHLDEAVLARLRGIPFYRAMLGTQALRSGSVDRDGTLRVEVDLRAAVAPRLAAFGLSGASDLLPVSARGRIDDEGSKLGLRESWIFEGPSAVLDVLDRNPAGQTATLALDAIPGAPSAVARVRLLPSRLTDPSLGGAALASWRDRVSFAEKLLGRPLRAEIAEDLAGPAVFALYETSDPTRAQAVLAVELRRSDRLAGLFEMLFGLGALAERASVKRYRGVATGSAVSESGGPGLALAVDGPVLIVTTSRALLESAIDTRRDGPHRGGITASVGEQTATWDAVSSSAFVAHAWARLARLPDEPHPPGATTSAALWPEGTSGWRLEGYGPAPAITADPMLPFLRSAFGKRQGEGD